MADLHDVLERESQRYSLPHGAAERMFERGKRRARNRKMMTVALSAALFVAVLVILRSSFPGADREPQPADLTPRSMAGTYEVRLNPQDPGVELLDMAGRFEMRLFADGALRLTSPRGFDLPGAPSTFEIGDGRLTTDALVGSECEGPATYVVRLDGELLTLTPIDETCELRRVVLGTRPWSAVSRAVSDPLEGEWTATFSCEQMVRAVRRAPVATDLEAFWSASLADQYADGPADLDDPCRDVPEPLVRIFRFSDGRLQIFDPPDLMEGFEGTYVIEGDVIVISDGGGRNIDGSYRVAFRIDGNQVTFDLIGRGSSDAFFVGAWESAPFVRTS